MTSAGGTRPCNPVSGRSPGRHGSRGTDTRGPNVIGSASFWAAAGAAAPSANTAATIDATRGVTTSVAEPDSPACGDPTSKEVRARGPDDVSAVPQPLGACEPRAARRAPHGESPTAGDAERDAHPLHHRPDGADTRAHARVLHPQCAEDQQRMRCEGDAALREVAGRAVAGRARCVRVLLVGVRAAEVDGEPKPAGVVGRDSPAGVP